MKTFRGIKYPYTLKVLQIAIHNLKHYISKIISHLFNDDYVLRNVYVILTS